MANDRIRKYEEKRGRLDWSVDRTSLGKWLAWKLFVCVLRALCLRLDLKEWVGVLHGCGVLGILLGESGGLTESCQFPRDHVFRVAGSCLGKM